MTTETAPKPLARNTGVKGDIYEVRFHGHYHTGKKGEHKPYEFLVKMDEKAKKLGFLHVFARQVLPDPGFQRMVAKKYPDWKRHRTHNEDGAVIIKPDGTRVPVKELGLMNYRQLSNYIETKNLGIETVLFPTAAELKQAIMDYRDNREAFLTYQEKKAKQFGSKLEVAASLRKLNDWSVITFESEADGELARSADASEAADLNEQDELEDLLNTV